MANKQEQLGASTKEGKAERVSRWLRNINLIGALVLGAAGVALDSGVLKALALINAGQAGFFELTRRFAKRKSTKQKIITQLKPT